MKPSYFLLLSFLFHLIFLYSIFDIRFKSPLVHSKDSFSFSDTYRSHYLDHYDSGEDAASADTITTNLGPAGNSPQNKRDASQSNTDHENEATIPSPPAKRLVFIVSDGLRAHSFFESKEMNFLSVSKRNASWGISHTRVPTESRPCHVAMIAGIYEDVSAVTTGWQENPVDFDSVFDQTTYTAQIGSPDVVKIFKGDNVKSYYYDASMEDFATSGQELDGWVFDKLDELLENDEEFKRNMKQERSILFLHLLGVDTAGHAFRPGTERYAQALKYVDQGVEKVYEKLERFFGDNRTSYIFTGDHGMTSRGSHGDGDPECTRTPFLVWGAGIRSEGEGDYSIIGDGSMELSVEEEYVNSAWGLNHLNRKDIRQADLAPLMSALLGLPYPKNNVGTLPLSYLGVSEEYRARNLYANALQILEQYHTAESEKRSTTRINFAPFAPLCKSSRIKAEIEQLLSQSMYEKAERRSLQLIDLALQGLKYFQTYETVMLMTVVSVGYLSWMAVALVYVIKNYSLYGRRFAMQQPQFFHRKGMMNGGPSLVGIFALGLIVQACFSTYLVMQSSPLLYHVYFFFPILFVCYLLRDLPLAVTFLSEVDVFGHLKVDGFLNILVMEMMVYGYFTREIFSALFLSIGILPVVLNIAPSLQPRLLWLMACISLSIFTILPADFGSDLRLVVLGAVAFGVLQVGYVSIGHVQRRSNAQLALFYLQLSLLVAAVLILLSTEYSLSQENGLPPLNRILSWGLLLSAIVIPFFSSADYKIRLQSFSMAVAVPFVLLSVGYEVFFFTCYDLMLKLWMNIEVTARSQRKTNKFVSKSDLVSGIFYILLFNIGFLGTGNLATLSSFELKSVYRFETVFNPFLMGAILVFKLLVPMISVSVTFVAMMKVSNTPLMGVLVLILALFDILTFNFFFLVTDYGSWQEIGASITRFAIGNLYLVFALLFCGVGMIYSWNIKPVTKPESQENKKDQ